MKILIASLLLLVGQEASETVKKQAGSLSEVRAYLKISDRLATAGLIKAEEIPLLKSAGFEVIINLAPADRERNYLEGFNVAGMGMTHVHIPVQWDSPELRDLEMFFDVMDANSDRHVFVHCNANMRVSVFLYLYRTLRLGVPKEEAQRDLLKIWDPVKVPQWERFIAAAEAKYRSQPGD